MKSATLVLGAFALLGAGHASAEETITYTYDSRGRLVEVSRTGSVNNGVTTAYQFDRADNRTSVTTGGSASTPSTGQATIVNRNGTQVSADSDGWQIAKTGAGTGFDASAVSSQGFSGDFKLAMEALTPSGADFYLGMNADPATDDAIQSIDYSLQLFSDGRAWLHENGSLLMSFPVNAKAWIWRQGTTLKYGTGPDFATASGNGLMRTVSNAAGTLYFDSSLKSTASAAKVRLDGATASNGGTVTGAIVARTGAQLSAGTGGATRILKTGSGTGFDASAVGTTAFAGDFKLQASAVTPGGADFYLGVNADPTTDDGYQSIDYSLQLYNDGRAWLHENGALQMSFPVNGKVWIWREGTTLRYGTGPDFPAASSAGLMRTVNNVTRALYFDSSFKSAGSEAEVLIQGTN